MKHPLDIGFKTRLKYNRRTCISKKKKKKNKKIKKKKEKKITRDCRLRRQFTTILLKNRCVGQERWLLAEWFRASEKELILPQRDSMKICEYQSFFRKYHEFHEFRSFQYFGMIATRVYGIQILDQCNCTKCVSRRGEISFDRWNSFIRRA